MEVSFRKEIESLRLGSGATFHGEGILAVTKALLQSGVAYVGGYQGAPVTHLLDVLVQSEDLLAELGVKVETCTNEAAAAAMLAASINYPVRGAVTWKSIVGTNVAADALSNLASCGVMGGALIIVGEDYGEGASVIQERTHAMALKSSLWLLDPRPELPTIVRMVEKGFELSEVSNTPVILELRIRACHVFGSFETKNNVAPLVSSKHRTGPAKFLYDRLSHPPVIFPQEVAKFERRMPAARKFIMEHKLNEQLGPQNGGKNGELGIIVQGGLFNGLNSRLALAGLSDVYGDVRDSDAGAERRPSAGARGDLGLLRRQEGGAHRRGRLPRLHRAGDRPDPAQGRPQHPPARQGRVRHGRRIHPAGDRQGIVALPRSIRAEERTARAMGQEHRRPARGSGQSARPCRCRRARRPSALAARSGRSSRP